MDDLFSLCGENDDGCEEERDEGEGGDGGEEALLEELLLADREEEGAREDGRGEGDACACERRQESAH